MQLIRGRTALAAVLLLALIGVIPGLLAPAGAQAGPPEDAGADTSDARVAMDAEACGACHGEVVEAFAGPHASAEAVSCVSCHGSGEAHIEAGGGPEGILSFGDDGGHPALVRSRACLECHGDDHPRFQASPHAAAGVGCASCHSVHSPSLESASLLAPVRAVERPMDRLDSVSRTCQECHAAVFTQFDFNEGHRLREGILTCASCHDPHAPAQRTRLAGFQRETCLECHADKGGPFVFEHGSSVVEGCTACHTPHGSPDRHMLNTQRVAETCFSCHPGVPGFHSRFTLDTVCTNCHSAIHGSNLHPAFLE